MDPALAQGYIANIRDGLSAQSPADKALFARNAKAEDARLLRLQIDIRSKLLTFPAPSRTMIIFHNAFEYYNARFGIRTIGVVETSPGQEPNPQQLSDLVKLARENHVRAVLRTRVQSQARAARWPRAPASRRAQICTTIRSVSTRACEDYESMLRYDTGAIVEALGGKP